MKISKKDKCNAVSLFELTTQIIYDRKSIKNRILVNWFKKKITTVLSSLVLFLYSMAQICQAVIAFVQQG